ncbi:MAG: hypothetical protein J0H39_03380 [Alphaproteobacteria bacterium]|nr:hypothetical protein [Alphaproteobacteria bacterium]
MGVRRSMSKFAALCAVLAALAACTQVDKAAAIKLADAGKIAATNGAAEAAAARIDFVAGGERNAAAELLAKADTAGIKTQKAFDPPNQTANRKRLEIAVILKRREDSLSALAATYGEMAALAAGDPGADIRKAVGDLVGKTNGLVAAVNAATGGAVPLIANTVGAAFAEAATLYAEERQRREILAANRIVEEALTTLKKAIEKERPYVTANRSANESDRDELTDNAVTLGLVDQTAALIRVAELAGFVPVKDLNGLLAGASIQGTPDQQRRQRIAWALAGFEKFRAAAKADAIADANATLEKAIEKLAAAHESLGKRHAFTVDDALAMALRMKEAVDRIRAIENGK